MTALKTRGFRLADDAWNYVGEETERTKKKLPRHGGKAVKLNHIAGAALMAFNPSKNAEHMELLKSYIEAQEVSELAESEHLSAAEKATLKRLAHKARGG